MVERPQKSTNLSPQRTSCETIKSAYKKNRNKLSRKIRIDTTIQKKSILINTFNEFKGQRKRIIFRISSKRGLIAGKPAYEEFMAKMMGGEENPEDGLLNKNVTIQVPLFFGIILILLD